MVKPDYAKWMVDDPRINFAISKREKRLWVWIISACRLIPTRN